MTELKFLWIVALLLLLYVVWYGFLAVLGGAIGMHIDKEPAPSPILLELRRQTAIMERWVPPEALEQEIQQLKRRLTALEPEAVAKLKALIRAGQVNPEIIWSWDGDLWSTSTILESVEEIEPERVGNHE